MRREGGRVFSREAGASGALVMVLEAAECRRRAKVLETLHSTARRGGDIQFLVIFRLLADKKGFELLDCKFATKVEHQDGRESNLAVAWKLKVLAIIDAGRIKEKSCFDGFWDVQPKSLSPNGAILDNMIRQGEEVRVREKCGGFVLVIEGVSIAHRIFKGMCTAWIILSRNCRKSASSACFSGRWQSEFEGPSDTIFTELCLCIGKKRDGVGSKATFSSATASICDLFNLVFNNSRGG